MNDNIATPVEVLFEKVSDYGKTTIELLKLKAIDKSANVVSSLVSKMILMLVVAMFVLTATTALALWLGELLGKTYHGFLVVAGLYIFIAILLYAFRNQWIKKPVSDLVIKQMYQ
jgi:preprotein translocase subunit SecY